MSGPSSQFPGKYPVLIGDRAFQINTNFEPYRRQSFHHDTIPSAREAVDLTDEPGEGTINVEGLWRRGQQSWHHGAGQLYLDRKSSDPFRFLRSQGIDPWNENQITLLPDTVQRVADGSTYNWCSTATIGGYVYEMQSNVNPTTTVWRVRYTTDYATWTDVTGGLSSGTGTATAICSNGTYIFLCGDFGVWYTTPGGSTWTQLISDDTTDHIYYVGNRLLVTSGPSVYDISNVKAGANPLGANGGYCFMTHPDPAWMWLDFTAGESFIYGVGVNSSPGGSNVGESIVYQFTVGSENADGIVTGTDLQSGVEALRLESGEFGGCLQAYQNYVFIGTNLGIRTCRTISQYDPSGNAGDLVSGPLLPTLTQPISAPFQPYTGDFVSGIVGYNRWVWFSWPQFVGIDGTTYWALGRLDLGNFVAELQPAYASDLLVASTSTSDNSHHTLGWCPITNGPLIVVPQQGLYTMDYNSSISGAVKYVGTGYLDSGRITWGIPDMKAVAQANLKQPANNGYYPYDANEGSVALTVSYDGGSFGSLSPLAPNQQANPPVLVDDITPAEEINLMLTLTAGTVTNADDSRPFVSRYTLKALPLVVSGVYITCVLMGYRTNDIEGRQSREYPYDDYHYLENLRLSQTIVTYQEGATAAEGLPYTSFQAQVVVSELNWLPHKKMDTAEGGYEGDMVITLKSIVG